MDGSEMKAIFHDLKPLNGFYEIERDFWGHFVWAQKRFEVGGPRLTDHYSLELCYYGEGEKLRVSDRDGKGFDVALHPGWNTYPLDLSTINDDMITFELSRVPKVRGDSRELGTMIRRFRPLSDRSVYVTQRDVLANKIANDLEFRQGRTHLETTPPKILITLSNICTMPIPCAYCDRERVIPLEGGSGFLFSHRTIEEMGDFYRLAAGVGDNSRGEPLLARVFPIVVERADRDGKRLEIVSNGQILTRKFRSFLLGKTVGLYFSIDAATPQSYARYRDADFHRLVHGVRRLCLEKKEHYNLPTVLFTFIAMKSNVDEIPDFFDLAEDVGVDGIKLRSLNADPWLMNRVQPRGAFLFDYSREILNVEEIGTVAENAKQLGRKKGIPVLAEIDFKPQGVNESGPLCSEPWKAMQILNIGIVTCIFARNLTIATWSERGDRTVEQFLWDVWSGEAYRQLRSDLAQGRIPARCLECRSCPIVKKHSSSS